MPFELRLNKKERESRQLGNEAGLGRKDEPGSNNCRSQGNFSIIMFFPNRQLCKHVALHSDVFNFIRANGTHTLRLNLAGCLPVAKGNFWSVYKLYFIKGLFSL